MNRRRFLKSFATLFGVGLIAPKLILAEEEQPNPLLARYKGRTVVDVGYFYCPYIPLQFTPGSEPIEPLIPLQTRYKELC